MPLLRVTHVLILILGSSMSFCYLPPFLLLNNGILYRCHTVYLSIHLPKYCLGASGLGWSRVKFFMCRFCEWNRTAGSSGIIRLSFVRDLYNVSQRGCAFLHSQMNQSFWYPTPSLAYWVASFGIFDSSNRCVVLSHCCFNSQCSNDKWCCFSHDYFPSVYFLW